MTDQEIIERLVALDRETLDLFFEATNVFGTAMVGGVLWAVVAMKDIRDRTASDA